MAPWYGLGSGDMLEVAHMGLHVAQMTSQKGIRACFDAVTTHAAKVTHLQGYGLEPGCDASFVLLQARDRIEAIRLRANRLKVWRKGTLVAEMAEVSNAGSRPSSKTGSPHNGQPMECGQQGQGQTGQATLLSRVSELLHIK